MHIEYTEITDPIEFTLKVILKEAKREERLSFQLFITMLSAYSNNAKNLAINAPSGVGKNHVINVVASLFPQVDIVPLAGMTEKALFHRSGILVIKNSSGEYESIQERLDETDDQIKTKECELSITKDRNLKQGLQSTIEFLKDDKKDLLKNAKKLIDLSNKIIIFLDTPPERLLTGLLPLLSHDKYEVEYEYVDIHNGIKTKSNVLRGWPVVIFAQSIDYSDYPRYPEIQRRFLITNPTMTPEKYGEAIHLISRKYGLPDLVYQSEVVSDQHKEKAREIILGLKEKITEICSSLKAEKNNVIIPFNDVISGLLPKQKVSDMTRANRLFSFLSFLPLAYIHERPRVVVRNVGDVRLQTIPIATFGDLQKTIFLIEYSDGIRPYILEWYYNVFLKAYEEKENEGPDSKVNSKGEELKEDRIALTSHDIIKKHNEIHNENLTSKQLLESYLYPLINQGYIDNTGSIIDKRANIYYPAITTRRYINLFQNQESNNVPQQNHKIVIKSALYPSRQYIMSKIQHIIEYYSNNGFMVKLKNHKDEEITIQELINQYFNNPDDYFEILEDSNKINSNDNDNLDDIRENNN